MVKTLKKLIFAVSAGLFVLTAGIVMPVTGATVDVSIGVRPGHNVPPERITNLTSLKAVYVAGGTDGRVELSWTAPATEGNILVTGYLIRWDTQSVTDAPFLDDTTAWWNQPPSEIGGIDSYGWWSNPGDTVTYTVDLLTPAATYYFAIKAVDEFDNISDIDLKTFNLEQPFAVASWDDIPPAAITNLSALVGNEPGQIKLSWTAPGDDGTIGDIIGGKYRIDYATYTKSWNVNNFEVEFDTDTIYGDKNTYVITGLPEKMHYFVIWTADDRLNWSSNSNMAFDQPIVSELNEPITTLSALTNNSVNGQIDLTWTSVGGNEYILKYATFSLSSLGGDTTAWWNQAGIYSQQNWSPSAEGVQEAESISVGLTPGTTYHLSIRAVNVVGSTSPVGNVAWAAAGEVAVTIEVFDIDFIKIVGLTPVNMTFGWEHPQGDISNIKGYEIERADDLTNTWQPAGFVYSTNTLRWTVEIGGKVYYYKVVTKSWADDRSKGLVAIDTSDDLNHIYLSDDYNAWIMIPYSFVGELNSDGQMGRVSLVKENNGEFLLSYNIKAVRGDKVVEDFVFKKTRKGAKIVISYKELQMSGSISAAQQNENKQLAMFWHNGVEWIKLGGLRDIVNNRVWTSHRRVGRFGIKFASIANEFTLNRVAPRIFTPEEGDYRINEVRFYFENPNFAEVAIKIFDITGAEIRKNLKRESENIMLWDGRDENNQIVRGGIYIYQIEADGKVINGTIVVAK